MLAQLYETIYLFFVMILSISYFSVYKRGRLSYLNDKLSNQKTATILVIIIILFIGFRPIDYIFVDTMYYDLVINQRSDPNYTFTTEVENLIFDNIMNYWAKFKWSLSSFFLLIASIYFAGAFIACKRLFPKDFVAVFIIFLAAFSTFSYSVNGIKAGAATSIFLVALSYRDKWKYWIPLLLLSYGFHHSMSFPIAAFVVTQFYNKPKLYFYFWVFCFVMAAAHVTWFQNLFANYTDEKGAEYLTTDGEDWKGRGGFRIDFIIYSAMPILMGWYAITKQKIQSKQYNSLLCMYLLTNAIWMLCMYVNYNNRIAYLSWFMYPFVLIYPLLNEEWKGNRYDTFRKVAYAHLFFTMFMALIYYGK